MTLETQTTTDPAALTDRELLEATYTRLNDLANAMEAIGGTMGNLADQVQDNGGGVMGILKVFMRGPNQ